MLADSYTRALKRYDSDLYAGRTKDGALCVFRKYKTFELVCEDDGFKLFNLVTRPQYVFALTENWALSGKPCQWGIDHVLGRVREMDIKANERFFDELDAKNEAVDEKQRRSFRNEAEAFFADNRKGFAEMVDSFTGCTHSVSKDEPRKRLKDRSIRNGNY